MRLHKIISSFRSSIIVVVLLFSCTMHCEARPPFACDPSDPRTGRFPFCNMKTSTSNRVRDLIKRLNLTEKIRLIVNNAIPIQRLGIKGYEWWSEALHGVSNTGPGVHFGGEFPGATAFPQVITTAASLNASLWKAIGEVVSDEARAMYNWGLAGLTFWSPNVNVFRDPRWGRGQETPGEDPFIVSKYAVNYVKGLQGEDRNNRLKVAACCKHYTAYDLDSWNGNNRFLFNAVVSKQDLEETYNVPFKDCVTKANVASVMCSYNQVNGKPTCADPVLLRDTIRGHWNLNGYIVSDCDSVDVFYNKQHYTSTAEEAAAIAIKAGLDLDCGPFLALHTEKAIQSHKLNVSDVDQALTNLITVQMRLGMYDDPTTQLYNQLGPNNVCTPAHQQLALEAAQQGIVLLKNPNRALPLPNTKFSTIAVIGPNANASLTMIGNYAGIPCHYTTPLQGISKYGKMTTYEIGCTTIQCDRYTRYKEAERAARRASATVLVMGLDQSIECEGLDRVDLLLPGNQEKLVTRVARASAGPVVLVIMSGGPIDVTFAKNDRNIDAILWVGYPGQAGGAAIADVIFGKFNPGGKLPMTWYPQEYLAKVPMTDMRMHADQATNYPGRTHRFYTGNAVYNFGDGLHYGYYRHTLAKGPRKLLVPIFTNSKAFKNTTSGGIRVSHTSCEALILRVHVDVENVGGMDGAHTVMAFVTTPSKEKRLVGFEKIHLAVGAKERVEFKIDTCDHMGVVDKYGIRRIERGEYKIKFSEDLTHTVTLYTLLREVADDMVPQEYLAKVPMTDMRMHADQATNYPGRTHRFYTGNAVYNFGDGLHYGYYRHTLAKGPRKLLVPIITNSKAFKNTTSGGIRVSHTSCEALRLRVHVDVENVGGMDGAHTVMAFVTTPSKEKRLVGFEKIHLAVGAKERVQFKIDTCDHMSVVDKYGIRRIERGEYKIKFNEDLTHTVTLYTLL